jgi:hypothetical protein
MTMVEAIVRISGRLIMRPISQRKLHMPGSAGSSHEVRKIRPFPTRPNTMTLLPEQLSHLIPRFVGALWRR